MEIQQRSSLKRNSSDNGYIAWLFPVVIFIGFGIMEMKGSAYFGLPAWILPAV